MRVTTQKDIRHVVQAVYCRYIVDNMQLNRNHVNVQFYTNHLLAKTKYLGGNTGAWVYTNGKFTVAYPCTKLSEVGYTLRLFSYDVGIPDRFRLDLAPDILVKHTDVQDK